MTSQSPQPNEFSKLMLRIAGLTAWVFCFPIGLAIGWYGTMFAYRFAGLLLPLGVFAGLATLTFLITAGAAHLVVLWKKRGAA